MRLESAAPSSPRAFCRASSRGPHVCHGETAQPLFFFFVSLMFKELMTGCGHHGDEGHKLLEVTLPIPIFVQRLHHFVHHFLLFDFLQEVRELVVDELLQF